MRSEDMHMRLIVAPVDGLLPSERALPLAAKLAHALAADLTLLYVSPPRASIHHAIEAQAAIYAMASRLGLHYGLEPAIITRRGDPAETIVHEATGQHAWAIVMGSHSRDARMRNVLGSVAEEVIDRSPVPVFVVPAGVAAPGLSRLERILVPLDGSARAASIGGAVRDLARATGARILEVSDLNDPVRQLQDLCRRERIDLVAFAAHGDTAMNGQQFSDVAQGLLRSSPAPVMVFGRAALAQLDARGRPAA
ncbi:MAG: universal stress protein [Chloroflexi bacterium]|nr:universal stress protein [Chloroflexota bacterium]